MHRRWEPQTPSVGRFREESTRRRLCGIILAGIVLTVVISVSAPNKGHVAENRTKSTAKSSFRGPHPFSQISKQPDSNSTEKIQAEENSTWVQSRSPSFHQSSRATPSVSPTAIPHNTQGAESKALNYTTVLSMSPAPTVSPISPEVLPLVVPIPTILIQDQESQGKTASSSSSLPSLSPSLSPALTATPTATIHDAQGAGKIFPNYTAFPSVTPVRVKESSANPSVIIHIERDLD